MTVPDRSRTCPGCGSELFALRSGWLCVNCSYEAAAPAESQGGEVPRRRARRRLTPLGFGAGDPCPRICGGTLTDEDGVLRCSGCDFRYPDASVQSTAPCAASAVTPLPRANDADPNAPPERDQVPFLRDQSALEDAHAALQRDCAALKSEHAALRRDHEVLERVHAILVRDHETLQHEHEALNGDYEALRLLQEASEGQVQARVAQIEALEQENQRLMALVYRLMRDSTDAQVEVRLNGPGLAPEEPQPDEPSSQAVDESVHREPAIAPRPGTPDSRWRLFRRPRA